MTLERSHLLVTQNYCKFHFINSDCDIAEPSPLANDKKLAADLFERSLSLVASKAMAAGVSQVWKTDKPDAEN